MVRLHDPQGRPIVGIGITLSPVGRDDVRFNQTIDPVGHTDFSFAALGMKYSLKDDTLTFRLHANSHEAFNPAWRTLTQPILDVGTSFWNDDVVIVLERVGANFAPEVGKLRVER